MSTRSGKRIHSSFHENYEKTEPEAPFKSERKTRNKRFKENDDNVGVSLSKHKKRQNYVSYPTEEEDEPVSETDTNTAPEVKSTRKIKKYTLKEHNTNVPEEDIFNSNVEAKKGTRLTRHTKKFAEDIEDVPISTGNEENESKKSKKNKKKRSKGSDINDNHTDAIVKNDVEIKTVSKKSKKKKKGKRSRTSQEPEVKTALNATNTSVDSVHSAAGSPLDKMADKKNKIDDDATFGNTSQEKHVLNVCVVKGSKKKSKATKTPEKCEVDSVIVEENHADDVPLNQTDTIEKGNRRTRKSSIKMMGNEDLAESTNLTKLNSTYDKTDGEVKDGNEKQNTTFEREPTVRRSLRLSHSIIENNDNKTPKHSVNKQLNSTFDKSHESSTVINLDSPFDKSNPKLNSTFDKNEPKMDSRKSSLLTSDEGTVNLTYDKEDNLRISITSDESMTENIVNTTPVLIESSIDKSHQTDTKEKGNRRTRKSSIKMTGNEDPAESTNSTKLNSTYDKTDGEVKDGNEKQNTTFEREPKVRRSLRLSHSIIENNDNKTPKHSVNKQLNSTFDKRHESSTVINLDSPFDKSNPKLNSTFDKNEPKMDSRKSSLLTSDEGTVNLTYDKEDNLRISITSDESKTENIVNTTPVLIESSIDKSHQTDTLEKASKDTLQVPITPLKREETFTKETAEVTVTNQTPTKEISLPSPGCTPFHTSRSSQKSVLNVTRSIEKRSSLVEAAQHQTKVMFCSPVNNPLVVNQQKRKVIKSSMKGSNKSFVFEKKEPAVKPAVRKRSFTHNDVEDRSSKRKRLAGDLQQSVDRLSRPRTSSASAKVTETPSKKIPTPAKPKSDIKRTKLPNFAALHRKEFAKMESLDECVDRKAKRARQLLTPNGAVTVLERSSPSPTEPTIAKDPVKEPKQSEKLAMTPKLTKVPTLESLRPGYTRFGFKMNCDVNPFSIPTKKESKPTEKKPQRNGSNAILAHKTPVLPTADKRQTRQPITTTRKEAAIRTVLREKSFTSLSSKRDVKRTESRTIIKGVRTNRRFELQMQMRNID